MTEELLNLEQGTEQERIYEIAKIEEKCWCNGISSDLFDSLINVIKNDESSLVKIMAIRTLYHEPSECWPCQQEEREKILKLIKEENKGLGMGDFYTHVVYELNEIEDKLNWLK